MDIIILLVCTFLIISRLMKMLGQYDPEQDRNRRYKTTVIMDLMKEKYNTSEKIIHPEVISPAELALPEHVRQVVSAIKKQDSEFDLEQFISRGQKAYGMYVNAISEKDISTLKNLVDQDLMAKISMENNQIKTKIESIKNAVLSEAALFGDRAMLTVDFSCSIISFSEDGNGNIISGSKNKTQEKKSQVTFCRYLTQEKAWKIIKEQK